MSSIFFSVTFQTSIFSSGSEKGFAHSTVSRRVVINPESDSSKSCSWVFCSIINTPTKKTPKYYTPGCPRFPSIRAVERMVDFTRGPGKILKYYSKRGKFRSLGPIFEVWASVKITASPPLSTALPSMDVQCQNFVEIVSRFCQQSGQLWKLISRVLFGFCSAYLYSFERFFSQLFNDVYCFFISFAVFRLQKNM
jgi:hypothetical protein